ncbi:hypothetical protein OKW22_000688 [Bacilli bacterium PM5-3]|nr:hypothetical protein [Bacilli bacterium PM5-3]
MKCYNCNSIIEMQPTCPVCKTKIDKSDYELESTKKILSKIKTIKDFAHFIGLFYVKSIILLIVAIVAIVVANYFLFFADNSIFIKDSASFMAWNRVAYMVLALVFVLAFNYYLEMRKVEVFYRDFEKNKNKYYIIWPFKTEYRSIIGDANEYIPNVKIMKKRYRAYEKRDKDVRLLRFNSYKLFHPQKPKLFMSKENFLNKHFDPKARHYLKTDNYDDESFVLTEGTIHGFLYMNNSVITLFNTPKLTKQVLNGAHVLEDTYQDEDMQF